MEKIIWMLWGQGEQGMTELVRSSVNSWRVQNPTWEVRLLTASSREYLLALPLWDGKDHTPAMRSDLVRLSLLRTQGGVRADATTICLQPLNDWLPDVMVRGFFIFRNDPIATWLIASEGHNAITNRWFDDMIDYWRGRKSFHSYFWAKQLFPKNMLVDFRYKSAHSRKSLGPHALCAPRFAKDEFGLATVTKLAQCETPLLKLSRHTAIKPGSSWDYIVQAFNP